MKTLKIRFSIFALAVGAGILGCSGSEDRVAELARLEAENKSLKLEVENLKLRMQLAGTKDPSTSVTNVLTDEIARRVIDGGYNGDLSKFTFIEDFAAETLSHATDDLDLSGLRTITPATAEFLAEYRLDLNLIGLTELSDAAAEALAKHQGTLWLNGLTDLTVGQAEALAKQQGYLYLDGLTSLSDATAKALAKHQGYLYLNGLTSLSVAQAEALAKHGHFSLNGLTVLSVEKAEALAKQQYYLELNGLLELSDAAAEAFSKREGHLELNGLTELSDASAVSLSKHRGDLELNGLTELSDSAADALAEHEGSLGLNGLDTHFAVVNNLEMIGRAMHKFRATHRIFPPYASTDKDGKPLLSWRVLLLPFLEHQQLYDQFHLDEPWDSEHNIKLIEQMPKVYRSPNSQAERGFTNYVTIRSNESMFPVFDVNRKLRSRGITYGSITDGASNTFMVVEANDNSSVIWTQPEDLVPDMQVVKRIVGLHPKRFYVGMADGSVIWLPSDLSHDTFMELSTVDGGEFSDADRFRRAMK